MTQAEAFDAIVLGGGAAGLFCAAVAGRRGRRVLVLEHNDAIGRKILISGGGRCNFTNIHAAPENFQSENPHFVRSALARFGPREFIQLVERHGIAWYEKTLGQLFCEGAGSARKIVKLLADECAMGDLTIRTGAAVTAIDHGDGFRVDTNQGSFTAASLVVATGGPPIPKLGATALAYEIAQRFGVPVVAPAPALVPLLAGERDLHWIAPLAGVSTPVDAEAGGARFREALLFTHRGVSGPAILQASSYWRAGAPLLLDFAPGLDLPADLIALKRARPALSVRSALGGILPARLAAALAPAAIAELPLGDQKNAALEQFARGLKDFRLEPVGDEGWAKAEVARGGVDTRALSSRTMACRSVPGLYFIGEAVDVTGWLGGYNFQWAWSSGWSAGEAL